MKIKFVLFIIVIQIFIVPLVGFRVCGIDDLFCCARSSGFGSLIDDFFWNGSVSWVGVVFVSTICSNVGVDDLDRCLFFIVQS